MTKPSSFDTLVLDVASNPWPFVWLAVFIAALLCVAIAWSMKDYD